MNPPSKLPNVSGDGPVAEGFRMSFETINQLIDYVRSITPQSGSGVDVRRNNRGVTLETTRSTGTAESDGDARWA